MRLKLIYRIGFLTSLCLCAIVRADDNAIPATARLRIPDAPEAGAPSMDGVLEWRHWLLERGMVVERCGSDPANGIIEVTTDDATALDAALGAGFVQLPNDADAGAPRGAGPQPEFFDPTEIDAMLQQIATDHPSITHRFSIGTTVQGRTIWAIEISNNPGVVEDKPAIQFNSQHHARELATSHIVMDLINLLTDDYGTDADVTDWVNNYKTVCVPMVNPDGVQYCFDVNSNWRKNRRTNNCTGSCAGTGVDLNRNYAYLWGPGCGSSSCCSNLIYRGPSSMSELEAQAMANLADQYHFVMATSYHSSGRFIDYPYACSDGLPGGQMPEHAVINEMMNAMADAITGVDGVSYTAFTPVPFGGVNGDDTSWYYAHKGAYPFIVEVGTAFEPPFSQVAGIVNRNRAGWRYLYDRLGGARIDVLVSSDCEPLEADVTLTDYTFDTGELTRTTTQPFGRWRFVVPPDDSYTVRVSKAGLLTQDVVVAVASSPVAIEVELVPAIPPMDALPGDLNGDCAVRGDDIASFIEAILADGPLDSATRRAADLTGDCIFNHDDVAPFVAALLGGVVCE